MMKNNCNWIGIGIDLPQSIADICIQLNREISKISPFSYKFSDSNLPHLNIYDLDVPENNTSSIISTLNEHLVHTRPFDVKILRISYFSFGMIFLEIKKSSSLLELHNNVVSKVSQFKDQCMCQSYLQSWRQYTPEQEEMLKKHGNPFVMSAFYPHISVGCIKAPEDEIKTHIKALNQTIATPISFTVSSLSIVDDAQKGHNVLVTFNLE